MSMLQLPNGTQINPLAVFDTVPKTAEHSAEAQGPNPDYEVQLRNFDDVLVSRYYFYNCPIALTPDNGKAVVYPITHPSGGTITIIKMDTELPAQEEE